MTYTLPPHQDGAKEKDWNESLISFQSENLIFDEATSSLDSESEKKVQLAIDNLVKDRTVIMIAHRLSTLKECDNIFLMDKGKVVDSGSYDYLIKNNLIFKQMSGENRTKFDDL